MSFVVTVVVLVCGVDGPHSAQTLPAPPQVFLDTSIYPATTGTIFVPAGGDFQGALNLAQPGDTIFLEAGATFRGPFTLPARSGSGWIVVRSSEADGGLPPRGTRMTPAYASALPKLVAPDAGPAVRTAPGAHHYWFTGIEIALASGVTQNYGLVQLGDGLSTQNSLSQVPYALVFDRIYVHGQPTVNVRRGIELNSASTAIIDSYIADIHEEGAAAQAIAGWNGPGPFKIVNNHLEGAGENLMFGGADPWIANLVPSDVEIRGNHFYKPLSWRIGDPNYAGWAWTVKNLFELTNARRVLVDGNVFEHNWRHAQSGFAILFTVRNQGGTAPWSVVEDVTFTNNILRHIASGVSILGYDDIFQSQQTKRILIKNNVFDDVSGAKWGGDGRLYQLQSGTADVVIDHNTGFQDGPIIVVSGQAHTRFVYRNNITPSGTYEGAAGDGTSGSPMLTLTTHFPGAIFMGNVVAGANADSSPVDNFFPLFLADVLFVDQAGGDYRLQTISPYKNAGSDGRDIGADMSAVHVATAGAVAGAFGGSYESGVRAAQPRGYQSRAAGWDLDFDGTLGKAQGADVAICDGTGGTNEDIDRNGVNDRQVYVDLTGGFNTTTCGDPASPCRTLQYALDGSNTGFADRIQAPVTNQIQAVCFKGTANVTVSWTQNGATGTYTRAATGNQVRSFQYPRYPLILSGWDADGDNLYPPHDPDDLSVVDGNLDFDAAHFILDVPHSRVEAAHFTVRDYGRACPAAGSGVTHFAAGSHVYYHDLDLIDNNRGCTGTGMSGTIQFDNFVKVGNITYTAVENVRAQNFGAFFWRGTPPNGTNGPYRFQNITATTLAAPSSQLAHVKPWGEIDGIEVLDSIWDMNPAAWEATDISGVTGVVFAQCVRDVDFINNEVTDFKVGLTIQPSAAGSCSTRNMDAITIHRNIIRNTSSTWGLLGHVAINIDLPETSGLPTVEDVDIVNNFISSTNAGFRSGILSGASHDATQPGTIRIAHNTIQGNSASFDLGAIGVCTAGCQAVKQNNYTIYNNVVGGGAPGGSNIRVVGYAPTNWHANGNIYQPGMNYEWNSTSDTLSGYQSACQGGTTTCDPISTESCTPSFVGSLAGDFHLLLGDVCAIDRGIDLSAITSIDIDGDARPQGIGWDVGADEFRRPIDRTPLVSITRPAAGATLSGTVTVRACVRKEHSPLTDDDTLPRARTFEPSVLNSGSLSSAWRWRGVRSGARSPCSPR